MTLYFTLIAKNSSFQDMLLDFMCVEIEQFLLAVCIFFNSILRHCLVQVGRVVLKHLPPHPQHAHGRGRGYVKQSVD